jgi:hypothetical protein
MKIEHYSFGKIKINGRTYTSDVIIFPNRVNPSWWRLEGHLLQIPDLKEIMAERPSVLVIGTGFYGTMKVPGETLDYLKSNNIEVYVKNTREAVDFYNEISEKRPTVAAFHLTC